MNKSPDEPQNENEAIQRFKVALDEAADKLDYSTQLALSRARAAALSQPTSRWSQWRHSKTFWISGAIPAALAVFFMLQLSTPSAIQGETHSLYEDMELLSEADDFDTLDNLEMYEWMSEQNIDSET